MYLIKYTFSSLSLARLSTNIGKCIQFGSTYINNAHLTHVPLVSIESNSAYAQSLGI